MPRPMLLTAAASDPGTPVIVAARRTPVGTKGGVLSGVDVVGLAAPVLRALVEDLRQLSEGVLPEVDDVVLGNCMGPGGDPARVAALAAGLGQRVPGLTVDRQCGSGLDAIGVGARLVAGAGADIVLAGGAESASTAPTRLALQPDGSRLAYERAPFAPHEIGDPGMGEAADALARHAGISRERQDAYASRSHARALVAAADGRYAGELVTVADVDHDERPRELSETTLSRFRPAFSDGGTVTAGNSCGISDGAAAVAVIPESLRATLDVPGLAVRAHAVCGVDPNLPGLGPVPAVNAVLKAGGLTIDDVGAFEVTEAFASQVLACTDALGLDVLGRDADRLCPDGGAIALGHPWGASGALLMVRLFATMVRQRGRRFGVATCAVGGGQGVATLVERVG